jgi:hypothetical protein
MPKWILTDTTFREHLRRLRKTKRDVLRFIAKTRNGEEVVVTPPLEAMRLVATGEIVVVSEPLWRLFPPDLWCITQKLLFYTLDKVEFIVTTGDLTIVPPENVREDHPAYWAINYREVTFIREGELR